MWNWVACGDPAGAPEGARAHGRHVTQGSGPTLPNHLGLVLDLDSCPPCSCSRDGLVLGPRQHGPLTWLLVGLWTLHYINRTLVFPFRLRTSGKRMPVVIVLSAVLFNAINGPTLTGWWLGHIALDRPFPMRWPGPGRRLFFAGWALTAG